MFSSAHKKPARNLGRPHKITPDVTPDTLQFDNMQHDLKTIRALLADKTRMHALLAQLEQQLAAFAGDLFDANTQTLSRDFMQRTSTCKSHKHLLFRYCTQWATSHGFSGVIKISKSLSPEEFASMLVSQSLFKDNAFKGKDHTALAHFWQWWCVTEYAAAHPGWMNDSPAELYRKIGKDHALDWDNTFEINFDSTKESFNFSYSRIEEFGSFLLSDECAQKFPVLHQLTIRSEKRKKLPAHDAFTLN